MGEGAWAASRQPRPYHQGCRHPQRTPETSRVGLGSPIGSSRSRIERDLEFEIPINSGAGPPICSPNPTSMVVGVLCGCMRPRWCCRSGLFYILPDPAADLAHFKFYRVEQPIRLLFMYRRVQRPIWPILYSVGSNGQSGSYLCTAESSGRSGPFYNPPGPAIP
ncbi:hypothetical protein CRG98_030602 [Punica granatum]|uniref:Uncharacterized protein n=1 Tax=Punica granatum TaxID=22663 RepID=A0A2I0IYH9_PUNGR|nr:hypothetical protein CRG98_030602 [Punica granatum]